MRCSLILLLAVIVTTEAGDMMRKSIIFDKKTPGVFYCPQHKPSGVDKMIVRSRPLKKLCEFDGKPLPEDYKSDCYHDVDETEYACKEKRRIMMRLHPPGSLDEDATTTTEKIVKTEKTKVKLIKRKRPRNKPQIQQ